MSPFNGPARINKKARPRLALSSSRLANNNPQRNPNFTLSRGFWFQMHAALDGLWDDLQETHLKTRECVKAWSSVLPDTGADDSSTRLSGPSLTTEGPPGAEGGASDGAEGRNF